MNFPSPLSGIPTETITGYLLPRGELKNTTKQTVPPLNSKGYSGRWKASPHGYFRNCKVTNPESCKNTYNRPPLSWVLALVSFSWWARSVSPNNFWTVWCNLKCGISYCLKLSDVVQLINWYSVHLISSARFSDIKNKLCLFDIHFK